jgi:hypothetical protein
LYSSAGLRGSVDVSPLTETPEIHNECLSPAIFAIPTNQQQWKELRIKSLQAEILCTEAMSDLNHKLLQAGRLTSNAALLSRNQTMDGRIQSLGRDVRISCSYQSRTQ